MKACGCRDCRNGKSTAVGFHRPNPENNHDRMMILMVLTWGTVGFNLRQVLALLSEADITPDDAELLVRFYKARYPGRCCDWYDDSDEER